MGFSFVIAAGYGLSGCGQALLNDITGQREHLLLLKIFKLGTSGRCARRAVEWDFAGDEETLPRRSHRQTQAQYSVDVRRADDRRGCWAPFDAGDGRGVASMATGSSIPANKK
jgi:hypothetical protein